MTALEILLLILLRRLENVDGTRIAEMMEDLDELLTNKGAERRDAVDDKLLALVKLYTVKIGGGGSE